jgi:hypothetical protein
MNLLQLGIENAVDHNPLSFKPMLQFRAIKAIDLVSQCFFKKSETNLRPLLTNCVWDRLTL